MYKWLLSTGIGIATLTATPLTGCSVDTWISTLVTITILASGIYNIISTGDISKLRDIANMLNKATKKVKRNGK